MPNVTRSSLNALKTLNFPNNTSQLISPADLRQWLEDGIDSFVTQKDKSRLENAIYENQGSGLAASATVDLASATGNFLHITGIGTISSFGTCPAGARFVLVFDGVCTLVYNATSLIIPGNSNKITAVNDTCMIISEGSGNWRIVNYFAGAGTGLGTVTQVNTGTGLTGGPITGTGTISLANTAVTPAAYTNANITVDAQGRITAASNGTPGGVTSVSVTSPITDTGTLTVPNIGIQNADADGSTKGAAAFATNDFNAASGVISLDYANGQKASGSQDGFLSQTDWTTFNNKQAAGNYITALTGDVTATGPGSVAATISNNAVTYGKLQVGSTNSLLLGTPSTGTAFQEITLGTGLTMTGGVLSSSGGGGTPGGSNTQLQFNNSGSFGGVPNATWDGTNLTFNTPRFGQSLGNGHFSIHRSNTVPGGATDYLTVFWNQTNKDLGFRFETDGFESYFRFAATTSDKTYTFPDLSGTIALLANPASFSSLTSTSSVTIGTAGPTGTTGTIVLQNATNANTLTLQSGTTSTSYTITLPPAASVGAQYLQTTGTGGTLQWTSGTTTGVSTVGAFSASAQTNGASISGSVITFGPASATVPGMVSTGTQIWDGNKTFQASAASDATVKINNGGNWSATNPQLLITSSGVNSIQWMSFGVGTTFVNPTTTTRSAGTKIVLNASLSAANLDYAIGVGVSSNTWISSGAPGSIINFYAGNVAASGQFQYDGTVRGLNLNASTDANNSVPQLFFGSGGVSYIQLTNSSLSTAFGQPAFSVAGGKVRSDGTKIVLFPTVGAATLDYALGVGNVSNLWISAATSIDFFLNSTTRSVSISNTAVTLSAGVNIVLAITTGTRIGTNNNQLLSFWNATPNTQPTSGITGVARTAVAGNNVTDADTFNGYTIGKLVAALQRTGIIG